MLVVKKESYYYDDDDGDEWEDVLLVPTLLLLFHELCSPISLPPFASTIVANRPTTTISLSISLSTGTITMNGGSRRLIQFVRKTLKKKSFSTLLYRTRRSASHWFSGLDCLVVYTRSKVRFLQCSRYPLGLVFLAREHTNCW